MSDNASNHGGDGKESLVTLNSRPSSHLSPLASPVESPLTSPVYATFPIDEACLEGQSTEDRIKAQETRARARFYEDSFRYKMEDSSTKENVLANSPVIADLRTNVIVKDEFSLVTDLSNTLSTRYHRSESSIMVNLEHSACLMLGGSFAPGYILTVTACPTFVQQTTNKRNTALLQRSLAELLGVPADRGIVKFVAISESCIGIGGHTVRGEIERLEGNAKSDGRLSSRVSRTMSNRKKSRKSTMSLKPIPSPIHRSTPPIPSPTSPLFPPSPSPRPSRDGRESRGNEQHGGFPRDGVSISQTHSYADSAIGPMDTAGRKPSLTPSSHPEKLPQPEPDSIGAVISQFDSFDMKPPPIPNDSPYPEKEVRNRKSLRDIFRRKQPVATQ